MAKKKKEITLQEIAEEMNDIMAYGKDAETGEVDEAELIDVDASDKVLTKEIIKRAEEDLRAADEDDFTPEAWAWFLENGIVPAGAETDNSDDDDDDDDGEPAPPKKIGTAKKAAAKDKDASSKGKKARVPGGNEALAINIVKNNGTYENCLDEFTKIYTAAGRTDKDYIANRARIYFGIACKQLGVKNPLASGRKGNPEALAKAREARKANAGEATPPKFKGKKPAKK
jgi:hypothetical protein